MRKAENRDNNRGERNAREKAGNVLKNSEVIAVRTCFSLFPRSVSVASTRSRLSQVRNKKKDRDPGHGMWEGARGEAKKYGEKKKTKSRIGEARTGRKRGTGDPETLWGHCRPVSF